MNEQIKTIRLDQVPLFVDAASKLEWTVFRIDPDTVSLPENFIEKVKELSEQRPYLKKDPGTYGEFYEGVSIQYSARQSGSEQERNYGSVHAKGTIDRFDPYLKQKIYFTGTGFSLKDPRRHPKNEIVNLDLSNRIDLQEILDTALRKNNITTYLFLNQWATIFKDIISQFLDLNIITYYGRFLRTLPGQSAAIHSDRDVRLHIPIYTNEGCYTTFYTSSLASLGKYHLPADGSIYIYNTHTLHDFFNSGSEPRLHAIFSITDKIVPSWKKEFSSTEEIKLKMKEHLKQIGN